jgi:cyclophilin family peptidyl-prolyl cis-trans isomerase
MTQKMGWLACRLILVPALVVTAAQAAVAQGESPAHWLATVETTKGRFVLDVDRAWAPHGADHFYELIRSGFYDDSRFTRVVPNFIVQFGVAGDSAKNARWSTVTIPDDSVRHSNVEGTFAFAMRGPNDRTTQLFISVVDNSRLDAQGFAPLGRVIEGMDVVKSIYSGYGERSGGGVRAGNQAPLMNGGNAYVDRLFPKLDRLLRITVSDQR